MRQIVERIIKRKRFTGGCMVYGVIGNVFSLIIGQTALNFQVFTKA